MLNANRLAIIATLLGVAFSVTLAQGQTLVNRNGDYASSSDRANRFGERIDRQGWRFVNGTWDNTCFRTLNHLPAPDACGGAAGE